MKLSRYIALLILGVSLYPVKPQAAPLFNPQNYPGKWTLVTNSDSTITATEKAIHRQGEEAYSRVLQLTAEPVEVPPPNPEAATEADIRHFIAGYRPPPVPYTTEGVSKNTGRKKFTCMEFAEDLVKKAQAAGIPAQIIGLRFEGKLIGHAVAGFPMAEGGMLYYDSTPAAGQISHEAHQAHVVVGQLYTRAGGGELAVVGKLPIAEVIPVTKPVEFSGSLAASVPSGKTVLAVEDEKHVQADGIDYAGTNTLQVSDDQLAKWEAAADTLRSAQNHKQEAQAFALNSVAAKANARALEENEEAAANNNAYGQLRMGERYLTGDGVEKNPALGKAYLKQAADQDNPTAIQELKRIDATQP
jgi:hypothetical protein